MFVIVICFALVLVMPMIAKVPLAIMMNKEGGYDNRYPRAQQAKLKGLGARANAAHQNCFEAICFFAPTVLLVLALDEHTLYTVQLCIGFVIARIFYLAFYWANWHVARSTAWVIAMGLLVPHYVMLF